MKILILSQAEIARLLPMADCMTAMSGALAALTRGEAIVPLRQGIRLPGGRGVFGVMPAYLAGAPPAAGTAPVETAGSMGLKAITVFPGNHGTELDSHQGAVLLFEGEHGRLLAVLDAGSVTAIRTAAVSGVATRLLAREDAAELAILGTGVQARTHLEAMRIARAIRRVRVFGRDAARVRAFADQEAKRHGIPVEAAPTAKDAVTEAHIVCTVTSSSEPVLFGEWLAPGVHVNAVGASLPHCRELDTPAVVRSSLFVDRRESTLNEAGDFLIPRREGAIGDDHIRAELGEVILGQKTGRGSRDEITLFKSLGLAVEDVAAARLVYAKAEGSGAGTWVELGGTRDVTG